MTHVRAALRVMLAWTFAGLLATAARAVPLRVVAVNPPLNGVAAVTTTVSITFDRAVQTSSINAQTFRVFGRWSGPAHGTYAFSDGNRTVTFTRTGPFSAGEIVYVTLSHNARAADLEFLRSQGYALQFFTATNPAGFNFQQIAVMSNRIAGEQTRIYGAAASDLDNDGYLDMTTVNEVSADIRVALNRGDGTGLYEPFLTPQPIGVEASPNDTGDFNADGNVDLCIAAVESNSIWVLLGAGNGTYGSITEIPVGDAPHGVCALDVDGDGDTDIVNSNNLDNNLSLLVNNGSGVFAAPVFFDSGAFNEYGLAAADMNGDAITDVVVSCRDGEEIVTMLGNGNATFSPAGSPQDTGGLTWVVALGDLNGDRRMDVALANSISNNGAALMGNGNGRFGAPSTVFTGAHTSSSDVGDLDGDGDMDWLLSVFGSSEWRLYENDGFGHFSFHNSIQAPDNPSCSLLFDFDNDRDLDIALTDEIADVVILMKNLGPATGVPDAGEPPFTLLDSSPQPARGSALIRFVMLVPGRVALRFFDSSGRFVTGTELDERTPGIKAYRFDGRDRAGRLLPGGVYYYSVDGNGISRSDRVVLVR